ncbi:hypothetical protein ACFOY6_17315 [Pseudoroseomonas aestuarii]
MHKPRNYGSSYDTPLGGITGLDLSSPAGMALLRRFDAQLRQFPTLDEQRAAVRHLQCLLPLSDRATGLLLLPGGSLALREGSSILVCDPVSARWLAGGRALRESLSVLPGALHVVCQEDGVCLAQGEAFVGAVQAASWLPEAAMLAPFHPACAGLAGPAVLRWSAWGAVLWRMQTASPSLAIGISVSGEALPPDGACIPCEIWDAPHGDERYQLLSSGLFAHLDELLGNEVSDILRFELVDHWTDGDDCMASQLADQLGELPACFARPWNRPVGLAALHAWPSLAAALMPAAPPHAILGIAHEDWRGKWQPVSRHAFLKTLRRLLPGTLPVELRWEAPSLPPQALRQLDADRQIRSCAANCAALLPLPSAFEEGLRLARQVAEACGTPVHWIVPAWGLSQRCDPDGGGEGNAAWYGLAFSAPEVALET